MGVFMAGSSQRTFNSTVCNVIGVGAASCSPALQSCDPSSRGGCPNLQLFAQEPVAAGVRTTFVTLFVPHSAEPAAPASVATLEVAVHDNESLSGGGQSVVEASFGQWTASQTHVTFDLVA